MKARWALCAVTALTGIIAAAALLSAFGSVGEPAGSVIYAGAPAATRWVLDHLQPILIFNSIVSVLMLSGWLAGTVKPTTQPSLRFANAAFSGWLLVETLVIWAAVLGILQQVSGLPDGAPARSALLIIDGTALKWLIPLSLCLPALQLGLGKWAYRLSSSSRQTREIQTSA